MKEEQVEKELKIVESQSRGRPIVVLVGIVVLLVLILGSYLNYTNRGPFQGEKIAGIPNNTIKVLEKDEGPFALLFETYGGYGINTTGKNMNVYVDYFEGDRRKKHDLVGNLSYEERGPINGAIYWGVSQPLNEGSLGELRVNLDNRGTQMTGTYDLSQIKLAEGGLAAQTEDFPKGSFKQDKPYIFKRWVTGGKIYDDNRDPFSSEVLAEYPQSVFLYLVVD